MTKRLYAIDKNERPVLLNRTTVKGLTSRGGVGRHTKRHRERRGKPETRAALPSQNPAQKPYKEQTPKGIGKKKGFAGRK